MTADEKYAFLNRDNLTQPIQVQLSKKEKTFSNWLAAFLKFGLNFESFEKKMTLIAYLFLKLQAEKDVLDKCIKSPVSQDPSTRNILHDPKHCWNVHDSTFIIFIDHCEENWVRKSLS